MISRRSLLTVVAATAAAPLLPAAALAAGVPERSIGKADAKVVVQEFFSLTCSHCAAFALNTFPRVKTELIDTGKVRLVWRDFPLDQVALVAAQVARSLPADRYEPFITALFASQDRWAFARGINNTDEIFKRAALAGMSRDAFDAAVKDTALRDAILAEQTAAEKQYEINSTPTFMFNSQKQAGAMSFDEFAKLAAAQQG